MASSRSSGAGARASRFPTVTVSLVLLVLLVVGMFVYYYVAVRPWTATPDISDRDLAALWEAVEREAAVPVEATGPGFELKHALEALEKEPVLEDVVEQWQAKRRVDDTFLGILQEDRDIGERLVKWSRVDGGFGDIGPCRVGEDFPPLELLLLGRLALAQTDLLEGGPSKRDRLRSVMHLSRVMRNGGGPLHLVAGLRLAEHAAEAAKRMGALPLLREMTPYDPREAEIWRAVNAEAWCADRLMDRAFQDLSKGWPAATAATRDVPRNWIDVGEGFRRRERLMVRWWYGEQLQRARPVSLDPPRLAEALKLPEDFDDLPKSLFLRILAVDFSEIVVSAGQAIESYRETVRGED